MSNARRAVDSRPPGPAKQAKERLRKMIARRLGDPLAALRQRTARFGRAQTAAEYALILVAVAVVVVGAYVRFDGNLFEIVFRLADRISDIAGD